MAIKRFRVRINFRWGEALLVVSGYSFIYRLSVRIALFVVCTLHFTALASPVITEPRFTRLGVNDGLSQSSANALLIDRSGFLWIGTDLGLNRYDGYRVTQIGGADNILARSSIHELVEDSDGVIWVSTGADGIFTIDPVSTEVEQRIAVTSHYFNQPLQSAEMLIQGPDGNIWAAMDESVVRYDKHSGDITSLFSLTKEQVEKRQHIRAIAFWRDQLLVAVSTGLYFFDFETAALTPIEHIEKRYRTLDNQNTKSLWVSPDDDLYIGTVEGLFYLSAQQVEGLITSSAQELYSKRIIAGRNIWEIVAHGNDLYLPTDKGLFHYSIVNEQMVQILKPSDSTQGISSDQFYDLAIDSVGNFWLASDAEGALYWQSNNQNITNLYTLNSHLSDDSVWSQHLHDDNSLWIGTSNGLNHYDLVTGKVTPHLINADLKAVNSSSSIYQILSADAQHLWLATAQGVYLFDTQNFTAKSLADMVPDNNQLLEKLVWGLYKDTQQRLWFINEDGFYQFDPVSQRLAPIRVLQESELDPLTTWQFLGQLPNDEHGLLISVSHSLWRLDTLSGEVKLLHRIVPTMAQRYIYPESWVVDRNQVLWISYPGYGLVGLDAVSFNEIYHFNQTNQLPVNEVYGLLPDKQGDIWMSSFKGILKMDADSYHVRRFSFRHGLASEEFNEFAAISLPDGRLSFGGMKGLTIFVPEELGRGLESSAPRVIISRVELLSRPLKLPFIDLTNTLIELNYDDVGLSVEFSSLVFAEQRNVRYQYELTGNKQIDYPLTYDNRVTFANLNPGAYQLSVWAYSAETGVRGAPATLDILVKHPPWASPWAYSLYLLFMTALILAVWWRKSRHRRLIAAAHQQTLRSEQRMRLALAGSNSGIWEWQVNESRFEQLRIQQNLGYSEGRYQSFERFLGIIHPQDRQRFVQAWQQFIDNQNRGLDITYRLRDANGGYAWFRDLGRKFVSEQQSRIIGTYTDVTEIYTSRERASLFGRIFEHSHEWVVVLDQGFRVIDANPAFRAIVGCYKDEDLSASVEQLLMLNWSRRIFLLKRLKQLRFGQRWNGVMKLSFSNNRQFDVEVDLYMVSADSDRDISAPYFAVTLRDITQQKSTEAKLKRMASYDGLTGLPNRMLLLDRLTHGIRLAARQSKMLAVMFIDLDKFKQVNDSLGHDAGDSLLRHVSRQISGAIRREDTVARLSGDEFVVVLEGIDADAAGIVAENINEAIQLPVAISGQMVSVSSSIGIAMYPADGSAADTLLKHADIAMYHSKASPVSSVQFYQQRMNQQVREHLKFVNALKNAERTGDFINYYQPVVDLASGKVLSLELLMRWQSEGVWVETDRFIPVAEESGLIIKMTRRALIKGLADLKQWYRLGYRPRLAINLSARHFDDGGLLEELVSLMARFDLPHSALTLEITESALMSDHRRAKQTMEKLTGQGFTLALDDFGTGYSSLKYLRSFPIKVLKIDRSFVADIGRSASAEGIINATLKLAESLNMKCIAEGIENREQAQFFVRSGCYWQQGYHYSKPVPAVQIPALLAMEFCVRTQTKKAGSLALIES